MLVELIEQAQRAIELSRAAGANEAAATITQSRDVTFEYRDGALEKVKDTTSQGLALQVYAAGRYSSHQTTDLNPKRLKSFVAEAVAMDRIHRALTRHPADGSRRELPLVIPRPVPALTSRRVLVMDFLDGV